MKIYVASSWRNNEQQRIVKLLRSKAHEVYDFRNPEADDRGFHWSDIDPEWQKWTPNEFTESLDHPIARNGFAKDLAAMMWADAFVLLLPCGRSAHLEAGWAIGTGKPTVIYLKPGEPELMYNLATAMVTTDVDLLSLIEMWS